MNPERQIQPRMGQEAVSGLVNIILPIVYIHTWARLLAGPRSKWEGFGMHEGSFHRCRCPGG